MGSVFGKETVKEPAFEILLNRTANIVTSYQIRKYGQRFAAECFYSTSEDTGTPFMALAKYIGVFGTPENEGAESISMTAPVVIQGGTKIDMTEPYNDQSLAGSVINSARSRWKINGLFP